MVQNMMSKAVIVKHTTRQIIVPIARIPSSATVGHIKPSQIGHWLRKATFLAVEHVHFEKAP